MGELLTMEELATELRRPIATLRWWRHQGGGAGPRSAKVGGRIVYRRTDVEAWIDAQFEAEAATA